MSSQNFKHKIFSQFARVGKALGNGNRLELLDFLAQSERNVEQLAQVAGLSLANTSQHLQHLRQAGLVTSRKQGLKVYYKISGADVILLLQSLRQVTERHVAEVNQLVSTYLNVKDNLEAIPRDELISRVKDGLVTVIDVRPVEEYAAGHIPGAINIPLHELELRLNELSTEQEIVAYCRGPHCVLAFDAVASLRQQGLQARRMQDGFPEWQVAGLPTVKNTDEIN